MRTNDSLRTEGGKKGTVLSVPKQIYVVKFMMFE